MCCIRLSPEAILVNFFGSPYFYKLGDDKVDVWKIQSCAAFLANNLPGYVSYNADVKALRELCNNGIFKMDKDSLKISTDKNIKRETYNLSFPDSIGRKIENIVDRFFQKKLYEEKIQPISILSL